MCWFQLSKGELAKSQLPNHNCKLPPLNKNSVLQEALRTHLEQAAGLAEQARQLMAVQNTSLASAKEALHNAKVSLCMRPCFMFAVQTAWQMSGV